jgi:3-deoxy-D-manno-octulosonic-acid transferase
VNSLLGGAYEGLIQLTRAAAAIAPPGGGKLLTALRARRGIRGRYARWGSTGRDDARALVWMHASSVGEGLQARPVLRMLRDQRAELQLAYSYFSPSAEAFAHALPVDFEDYLPFDSRGDARAALDALRPRVLAFSKLDVWPALVAEAHARGVRLALISATLAEHSKRRSALAAALARDAYAQLDAVGAIDERDARRLVALGVRDSVVTVTGDTRYDQVWARMCDTSAREPLLAPLRSPRPTVVAGSTWPEDERPLLAAWLATRGERPRARLIIAPHEPTFAHLAPIERWAAAHRIKIARLGAAAGARDAEVVLVDRVGVLGDLYALADIAFVGGGFHRAGLHSVLEPAAFGVPVLFGPRYQSSRDASLLLARGGGATVADGKAIAAHLRRWLTSHQSRMDAGAAARALVEDGTGAAARSFALITALLDG